MSVGFFAVLDDIAILLDDAAVASKIAAQKTAGILGDDLAVNAEKATGFHASRELPVIWSITKGSMINKLIILPLAFLLSAFVPELIVPILLAGGVYLSYEGAEKIIEWVRPHPKGSPPAAADITLSPKELVVLEQTKIKSAVRTDFILSIEIIVIALGTVLDKSFALQVIVVSAIALLATVGVYGMVALLVRMDDVGAYLVNKANGLTGLVATTSRLTGNGLITLLPHVIRLLGVVGTLAMLLVGGGMFVHNIDLVHHLLDFMPTMLSGFVAGLVVGGIAVAAMSVLGLVKTLFYPPNLTG